MIINLKEPSYDYDKFISDAKQLAKQYKDTVRYVTIGTSHDNRDIVLLKLGLGKKYLVCSAGVHGRETINPIVLLKIIEYYAEAFVNYKTLKDQLKTKMSNSNVHLKEEYEQLIYESCIYELLQTFTILFIPLLNPDGYMISLYGFDSIRDEKLKANAIKYDIPYQEWKYNARGVDINRNFPSRLWKPKGPGDYAASENETKTLIMIFHHFRPRGYLDFHSRGKEIYYYRRMMSDIYNERQFRIADKLKLITGYELVPPEEEIDSGDSGGNTVHYFSERFFRPAITIETVDEEAGFPLDINYRATTFEEVKLVIFKFGSLTV